jgi:hypothetical protein
MTMVVFNFRVVNTMTQKCLRLNSWITLQCDVKATKLISLWLATSTYRHITYIIGVTAWGAVGSPQYFLNLGIVFCLLSSRIANKKTEKRE